VIRNRKLSTDDSTESLYYESFQYLIQQTLVGCCEMNTFVLTM